jgi:hypothetical protein
MGGDAATPQAESYKSFLLLFFKKEARSFSFYPGLFLWT